jgi:outer membrane receptor protein involved in Fe transport
VTGVVNFVLDTDFEGIRGGIGWAAYQHDNSNATAQAMNEEAGFPYPNGNTLDGEQYNINLALGGKFADGKGHASMYLDYRNIDSLTKSERDYTNCSVGRGDDGPSCSGSSTIPYGRYLVYDPDWNGVGDYVGAWGRGGDSHSLVPRSGDVFNYGPFNHMQRPDQRWLAGGFANYEINEHFDVYTEVMFMDDYSKAQIAPSADFGSTDTLNCDNPMLSDQQRDLICTQAGFGPDDYANVVILRRSVETGPRTSIMRHTDWRLVAGMRGDINDYWSYDVYGLYAEVLSPQEYVGDLFVPRIVDALDVIGDPDDPSTWECRSGNPGCAPWNVFQEGGVTQAAADYIALNEVLISGTKTQMISGTLNGDLEGWGLKFPSATEAIQVAVGADYREESLYVHPDEAFEGGLGSGAGGPTVRVDGAYDVTEFFVEALVPLIQDAPLSRDLSLELGYRYSDYSTSGGQNTWKAQGAWAPTDDIKFRLGYAQAVRAPNVRELFRPQGLGLGGSEDPCANDPDTGVPSLSLAECQNTGMTAAQYGHVLSNPADQYNTLEGGNPDLQPETATTLTAGVVFTPQSISGFSLALDYYDIKIEDTIQSLDADSVVSVCAANGDPTLCGYIHRDIAGTLWLFQSAYTVTTQQNIGEIYGEGVDLNYSWLIGLGNSGFLNTSLMGTYVLANRVANPLYDYDCVGYYGNQCAPYPTPKWRHRARFSWETNFNMVFSLGWRYVGSVLIDDASPNPDLANPGLIDAWKANDAYENPSYNYIDLAWTWQVYKSIQLVAGCNNIFDEEPPLGPGLNDNDYGPGFYGFYDPYGRTLHAALHFDF